MSNRLLNRDFYNRKTEIVAKELLGKYLVREVGNIRMVGKIVETEAYLGPHDLAAHSRFGMTKRNKVMFGEAGYAYVYLIYGIYHCLNIVTEKVGHGSAILIRAVEPMENINRKMNGPGLLCRVLEVTRKLNGVDMTKRGGLYVLEGEKVSSRDIVETKRIGIEYAGEWKERKLRFYIAGNQFLSRR